MATRWTRVRIAILLVVAAGAMLRPAAAKRNYNAVAAAHVHANQRINAMHQGSADSDRQSLLRGADPDAWIAPNGATALRLATHLDHEALTTQLLDRGRSLTQRAATD